MNRAAARVAVAATLWGLWPLWLRPSGLTGAQCSVLTLAVMSLPTPFLLRRGQWADRGAVWALLALGLGDAFNSALYFSALQRGPVVVATLTHYLTPLLVALAAPVVFREPLNTRALVAGPVILLGLALVLGFDSQRVAWQTAALGAGSAVFFASNVLVTRRAARAFTPLQITALHGPVSVLVLLVLFREQAVPATFDLHVLQVMGGALISGLLATALFNWGLRGTSSAVAGVLTYLEPLVATVVGALAFSEALGGLAVWGAALVLGAGAWVVATERPARADQG